MPIQIKLLLAIVLIATGALPAWWLTKDHYNGIIAEIEKNQAERDRAAEHNNALTTFETEERERKKEQAHADLLAAISTAYEKRIHDEKVNSDALVAQYRSGALRLYDRHATVTSMSVDGNACQAATTSGRCDGTGDGGLSAVTSGDLLDLGGRCNLVRDKLTTCQAIAKADRAQ